MPKFPVVRPREAERAILRAGFTETRSSGSHRQYAKPGHPHIVTIAFHPKDVPQRDLRNILRQSGLTVQEFIDLL